MSNNYYSNFDNTLQICDETRSNEEFVLVLYRLDHFSSLSHFTED